MSENIVEKYTKTLAHSPVGFHCKSAIESVIEDLFYVVNVYSHINFDGRVYECLMDSVDERREFCHEVAEAAKYLMQHAYNMGKMEAEKEIAAEYNRGYNDGYEAGAQEAWPDLV